MDGQSGKFAWQIDNHTQKVLKKIRQSGDAWIVGGWVRDSIIGELEIASKKQDIDITTNLIPSEIMEIFPKSIIINENFGTVLVRLNEEFGEFPNEWEVTTLRTESEYSDGRRPDSVKFGDSILADISRRDFTINAMAINDKNELIDFEGKGVQDLENNIISTVGNANKRIQEDGLRIVRAFRFIGLKNNHVMEFDDELKEAISNNTNMIKKVSGERIYSEILKIMNSKNAINIISYMENFGIIKIIFPNLEINLNVQFTNDYRVNLALLFSDEKNNNKNVAILLKEILKISNSDEKMIRFLIKNRRNVLQDEVKELRRFRAFLTEEQKKCLFDYYHGIGMKVDYLMIKLDTMSPLKAGNEPLIDGNLLAKETGLPPGKRLGKLKSLLHRKQIEKDIGTKNNILKLLNEIEWKNDDPDDWECLVWP